VGKGAKQMFCVFSAEQFTAKVVPLAYATDPVF
jgi:hypothetical protein